MRRRKYKIQLNHHHFSMKMRRRRRRKHLIYQQCSGDLREPGSHLRNSDHLDSSFFKNTARRQWYMTESKPEF
jgi:hypothetical protein